MNDFPDFMKNTSNEIDSSYQSKGIKGYVYDGIDESQMAYWTCYEDGISKEHYHDYDEYFVVVEGRYILIINNKKIKLKKGDEYYIPKGIKHSGEFIKGTRTIHVFGGKRAKRKN